MSLVLLLVVCVLAVVGPFAGLSAGFLQQNEGPKDLLAFGVFCAGIVWSVGIALAGFAIGRSV